jgi:hypothetical protein
MDRTKIPFQFLKKWESWTCCGRRVVAVELFDSTVLKRSLPRQYGITVTFQNGIQVSLDPILSEADAQWTLRQRFMEELEKRRVTTKERKYKFDSFEDIFEDIISQPITPNLEDDIVRRLNASIKKILKEQKSQTEIITFDVRLNDGDTISVNPFKEDENVEEDNTPEEIQRFADILDDD